MGSQAIPNGSLVGAVVGVPQIVSWQTLNLFTAVGVQNPATTLAVVELLNVSGSLCRIRFPLSNIQRLLPPNGWIQVSVNQSEVSYELTPLAVVQVLGVNAIAGIYYPAGTPPSEIVALGGSGGASSLAATTQQISARTTWNPGDASPKSVALNPPLGQSFYLTEASVSHEPALGTYPIIGKSYQLQITAGGNVIDTLWRFEDDGPLVLSYPQGIQAPFPTGLLAALALRNSPGTFTYGGAVSISGYFV